MVAAPLSASPARDRAPRGSSADPAGLTTAEAARRLAIDGPNALPPPPKRSPIAELLAQWTHFFARLLWVGALLAAVAGMPQLAIAIAVVVLVNGLFAFVQEHRAERAAEELQQLLPTVVDVRRDGQVVSLPARELVRGDRVLLAAGNKICADLDVVSAAGLAVDTSSLTGESVPDHPSPGDRVLAGMFVVEGEAETLVRATGAHTELAAISGMTTRPTSRRTPLAVELDRLVRLIAAIALGVGVGFFLVSQLVGMAWSDGFLFGVGVMVALVPEGLLPTVTLSLAVGAQRMARSHALVRRLDAVETLGATTFICTDKTGTLTRNQMTVVGAWTPAAEVAISDVNGFDPTGRLVGPDREAVAPLAAVARRCSDGRVAQTADGAWSAVGDPMEAAIDVLARRTCVPASMAADRRFPFDPRRRRMSVLSPDGQLFVKGAPDSVLPRCHAAPLTLDAAQAAVERFATNGWRTLAIARRSVDPHGNADPVVLEQDLELLGILAFEDPPREGAAAAIAACRRAGIRVGMITGDHPATAAAIAREIGLIDGACTPLVGDELPDDDELLGALLDRDGLVVARVRPEHKLRIAAALRRRGHVVAMTGDGVNDGPAIREADIGIAMGRSGTDVAREAADLVLLDDDFSTIVRAIEQGRSTFLNVRRFLTYHLTDNVAELTPFVVWALTGGQFPLAIGVLQVLALDIGTDLLPALALGGEPPRPGLLDRPPTAGHLIDRTVLRRAFGRLGPTEALVEMAAFVAVLAAAGWRPGGALPGDTVLLGASGAAFTAVVLGQMATALACRSTTRWAGAVRFQGNPALLGAIVVEIGVLVCFLLVGPIASLLDHRPPPLLGLAVALTAVPAIVLVDLADKWHRRRVEDWDR